MLIKIRHINKSSVKVNKNSFNNIILIQLLKSSIKYYSDRYLVRYIFHINYEVNYSNQYNTSTELSKLTLLTGATQYVV